MKGIGSLFYTLNYLLIILYVDVGRGIPRTVTLWLLLCVSVYFIFIHLVLLRATASLHNLLSLKRLKYHGKC